MLRYLQDKTLVERRARALEHWHQSLELNPDQPRIRQLIAQYSPTAADPEADLLPAAKSGTQGSH
jgi:hypothetical protein